jgi:hypothetical protein
VGQIKPPKWANYSCQTQVCDREKIRETGDTQPFDNFDRWNALAEFFGASPNLVRAHAEHSQRWNLVVFSENKAL